MRVLSGIQPTGPFHWGNYFGAIRQYIALQENEQAFYFIADLHALTTIRDPEKLRDYSREAAVEKVMIHRMAGQAIRLPQAQYSFANRNRANTNDAPDEEPDSAPAAAFEGADQVRDTQRSGGPGAFWVFFRSPYRLQTARSDLTNAGLTA